VLTNRERRRFESNSYPAGGVFLTLTVQTPARVAQATVSYDSGIAGPNDVATPRATLCQVIGTLTPPWSHANVPKHILSLLQEATYHSIPGLNHITRLRGRNDLSGQLSVRLRST
jgi:hypothetical protein